MAPAVSVAVGAVERPVIELFINIARAGRHDEDPAVVLGSSLAGGAIVDRTVQVLVFGLEQAAVLAIVADGVGPATVVEIAGIQQAIFVEIFFRIEATVPVLILAAVVEPLVNQIFPEIVFAGAGRGASLLKVQRSKIRNGDPDLRRAVGRDLDRAVGPDVARIDVERIALVDVIVDTTHGVPLERVFHLSLQRSQLKIRAPRIGPRHGVGDLPAADRRDDKVVDLRRPLIELIPGLQVGEDVADTEPDVGIERTFRAEPDNAAQLNRDLGQLTDREEAVGLDLERLRGGIFEALLIQIRAADINWEPLARPRDRTRAVRSEELDVPDRGFDVGACQLDGEPAGEPVADVEVKPEIIRDRRFVQDIDIGALIDIGDRRTPVFVNDAPVREDDVRVAADVVGGAEK